MYIKHFFDVDLKPPVIRILSRKDNGEFLYPYKNLIINIQEVHICPFCGKVVRGFCCGCEVFKQAFQVLQESYGDEEHKSCLHGPELNIQCGISKSISDFQVKTLSVKEIDGFCRDLWDYATRHTDCMSDRSYLVAPATQEGDDLCIICKDLISKSVYSFETSMPKYQNKPIFLGIYSNGYIIRRNNRPKKLGSRWKNLEDFEDWNDLCETLKKVLKKV